MKHRHTDNKINKEYQKQIFEEYKKGNIVIMTVEGPISTSLASFIKQPADGILYDLNHLEETASVENERWINDLAVAKTIRALCERITELEKKSE